MARFFTVGAMGGKTSTASTVNCYSLRDKVNCFTWFSGLDLKDLFKQRPDYQKIYQDASNSPILLTNRTVDFSRNLQCETVNREEENCLKRLLDGFSVEISETQYFDNRSSSCYVQTGGGTIHAVCISPIAKQDIHDCEDIHYRHNASDDIFFCYSGNSLIDSFFNAQNLPKYKEFDGIPWIVIEGPAIPISNFCSPKSLNQFSQKSSNVNEALKERIVTIGVEIAAINELEVSGEEMLYTIAAQSNKLNWVSTEQKKEFEKLFSLIYKKKSYKVDMNAIDQFDVRISTDSYVFKDFAGNVKNVKMTPFHFYFNTALSFFDSLGSLMFTPAKTLLAGGLNGDLLAGLASNILSDVILLYSGIGKNDPLMNYDLEGLTNGTITAATQVTERNVPIEMTATNRLTGRASSDNIYRITENDDTNYITINCPAGLLTLSRDALVHSFAKKEGKNSDDTFQEDNLDKVDSLEEKQGTLFIY